MTTLKQIDPHLKLRIVELMDLDLSRHRDSEEERLAIKQIQQEYEIS